MEEGGLDRPSTAEERLFLPSKSVTLTEEVTFELNLQLVPIHVLNVCERNQQSRNTGEREGAHEERTGKGIVRLW